MGGLSEEEEGETVFDTLEDDMVDDNEPAEPKVTEFKTPSSLTTVTVIEDFELEDTYQSGKAQPRKSREGDEGANADETTNKAAKQYKNTAPTTKSKSTAPKGGGNTGKKGKRMR
ncbi:hypothetical protein BC936DRAFT_145968 [Jimgerdemannia flammicorona]|uniref:Uncharacterized protein n=1 Tax=Jimgerdemannia flammicorona TaxID=994334 RepID=A0A433D8P1_9FUNG|nr:hypothetical protein BC936DRAFT_145968 [Jimgerdemannia flammicorona]